MTGDGDLEISSEMVESFLEESQRDYKEATEVEYLTEREADSFLSKFVYKGATLFVSQVIGIVVL